MGLQKILAVAGPTASGKSRLALSLAKTLRGEIISCDSMQLYCGMDIGTAKPTDSEKALVPHHMIDILNIGECYSVSDYVKAAEQCVSQIAARGNLPVLCGGTGLYLDSFLSSTAFGDYENNEELRAQLEARAASEGLPFLYAELQEIDPETAEKIHVADKKRVLRALLVYRSTGIPLSEWNHRSKLNPPKFDSLLLGLLFENREVLYERINRRVELMLEEGLVEETRHLLEQGLQNAPTAGQAIGYKELYPYFTGEASLAQCAEALKQNTRRYAKRQMTWFRRNSAIRWIVADNKTAEEIDKEALQLIEGFLEK